MGPKRNVRLNTSRQSSRLVPYNLDLPENWTVTKLKRELNLLSILFSPSSKRSQLITLYKQAKDNSPEFPRENVGAERPGRMLHRAPTDGAVNNNGDILTTLNTLARNIDVMRTDLGKLSNKVITLESNNGSASRQVSAAAGSEQQAQMNIADTMNDNVMPSTNMSSPFCRSANENFNLTTAMDSPMQ